VKVATQGGKPVLPPNFPRDVPRYPGATVESSLSVAR